MVNWNTNPDNPVEAPDPQYAQWDQGEYEVNGIEGFIKEDEAGLPFFEPSPIGNLQTKVHLRLAKPIRRTDANGNDVEDHQGPPMSMGVPQLVVFCDKLGANVERLQPIEATSGFILRVKELLAANASTSRKLVVYVNESGWGARFKGTFAPPVGEYTMKVADIYATDGSDPLDFKDYFNNKAMKIAFEIVGDRYGKPTPFAGFTISEPLYKPFQDNQPGDVAPNLTTLEAAPDQLDSRAVRFLRLLTYFTKHAPDGGEWGEYRWEADPTASQFGVNELQLPMVVVKAMIHEANMVARGELSTTNKGRPKVDLLSFVPTDQVGEDPEGVPGVDVDEDKGSQPEQVYHLVTLIETLARTVYPKVKESVFQDTPADAKDINLTLTEEGKEWCRAVVVPVWDELGLPPERQFALLDGEQADKLRAALDSKHGSSGF